MKEVDIAKVILAYQQQLSMYKHKYPGVSIPLFHKRFWIYLSKTWDGWKETLVIVQPNTVVRWHKLGWNLYWKRKSKRKNQLGRPVVNVEIQKQIKRLSKDNPSWGNKRLQDELGLLGTEVSLGTVAKYRIKTKKPSSQSWKIFIKNQMHCSISMDFFGVPDVRFRMLYGLIILDHARRKILTLNATTSPNSQWVAQQIKNALFCHTIKVL